MRRLRRVSSEAGVTGTVYETARFRMKKGRPRIARMTRIEQELKGRIKDGERCFGLVLSVYLRVIRGRDWGGLS